MTTSIEVVIPVLNEERGLPQSIRELHQFLSGNLHDYDWRIVIADNGSTDSTLEVARHLSEQYPHVGYIHLDQRGRGAHPTVSTTGSAG